MHPGLVESKANSIYRCTALTSLSQPCLPVSNMGPTRILPFLYLGSQQDALSLETAQVEFIIGGIFKILETKIWKFNLMTPKSALVEVKPVI